MLSKSKNIDSKSASFDILKQELKDKDELISALKQKLEIMESFHCSSSSFDALNSFQGRRSSSVVVIAENESIPSPTFKSFRNLESSTKTSKRGSNIFQKMNKFKQHDQSLHNSSNLSLDLPKQITPHIQTDHSVSSVRIDFVSESKESKFHKFIRVMSKLFRSKRSDKKKFASAAYSNSANSINSDCFAAINSSYSYEKIISGQIQFDDFNIERVESYLKWDDCIEYLGTTKEELKFLRTHSLIRRKWSACLCPDQLKFHSKEINQS